MTVISQVCEADAGPFLPGDSAWFSYVAVTPPNTAVTSLTATDREGRTLLGVDATEHSNDFPAPTFRLPDSRVPVLVSVSGNVQNPNPQEAIERLVTASVRAHGERYVPMPVDVPAAETMAEAWPVLVVEVEGNHGKYAVRSCWLGPHQFRGESLCAAEEPLPSHDLLALGATIERVVGRSFRRRRP